MKYIAFVTKGLEMVSEKELQSIDSVRIISNNSKLIQFEYLGGNKNLAKLQTVDDIAILINEIKLSDNIDWSKILDSKKISELVTIIKSLRNINPCYSVTMSNYKSNLKETDSIKNTLIEHIGNLTNYKYTEFDHSNLDFRVNINSDSIIISLKLFSQSLFNREYEHEKILGSLRSTIANSIVREMLEIIGNKPNLSIVDNFCGSGTFLCEGHSLGLNVFGSDIDPNAVETTIRNLTKNGLIKTNVIIQDSRKTTWNSNSFELGVANFPWDKQVILSDTASLFDESLSEYRRTLKEHFALSTITTNPDLMRKYIKLHFPQALVKEFKIGYIGQTPTIFIVSH